MSSRESAIYKVTWIGLSVNILLSIGKLFAGIVGRSGAMIADGAHSVSDVMTDIVVLVFVKVSSKPKDANHHYGHGKFETLASIIIGLVLLGVGLGVFWENIQLIWRLMKGASIPRPGMIAFWAAAISIIAKETLFQYTMYIGKRENSSALRANAWHHRSDAFSSIGALAGIGGAHFLGEQWRILDPIAALLVSFFIAKVAWDLMVPGIKELMETSLPQEIEREIMGIILQDTEIQDPHNLKTRRIGPNMAIEIHIRLQGSCTLCQAHEVTVHIEQRLRKRFGPDTQVIVHAEPVK